LFTYIYRGQLLYVIDWWELTATITILLSHIKPAIDESAGPSQFAYKTSSSTIDAVASLSHSILSSLDHNAAQFVGAFLTIPQPSTRSLDKAF